MAACYDADRRAAGGVAGSTAVAADGERVGIGLQVFSAPAVADPETAMTDKNHRPVAPARDLASPAEAGFAKADRTVSRRRPGQEMVARADDPAPMLV